MKLHSKIICVVVFLFISVNTNAQDKSIELPDMDEKLGILFDPYVSIYVLDSTSVIIDKNRKVSYSDTIPIYRIKDEIYLKPLDDKSYSMERSLYLKTYIHLFADRNISYSVIDAIKTELSATNKSRAIIYRSNFDGSYKNVNKSKGIKHKSPPSFFKLNIPEYRKTKKEIRVLDSLKKQQEKEFPHLAELNRAMENPNLELKSIYSLESSVYGLRQEIIDESLENKKHKCYSITNKGFKDSKKEYDLVKLESVLKENDVVFLDYHKDLIYENYLKFIKELHKHILNFGGKKVNTEVIELSNQIKKIHKLANVKLCN